MELVTKTRKEYELLISQHEAVQKLNKHKISIQKKAVARPGVPLLLQDPLGNENINTAVTSWQKVMEHHERVAEHTRKRLRREKISLNQEMDLLRLGADAESEYKQAVKAAFKVLRASPVIKPYATAILESTEAKDLLTLAHPSSLTRDELAAMKYMGIKSEDYNKYYEYYTNPELFNVQHYRKALELLASDQKDAILKKAESVILGMPFPESPRNLTKQGIITFGGSGGISGVFYAGAGAVGAAVAVSGVGAILLGLVVITVLVFGAMNSN